MRSRWVHRCQRSLVDIPLRRTGRERMVQCRMQRCCHCIQHYNCIQWCLANYHPWNPQDMKSGCTHQRTQATTGRCARNTLSRGSRNVGIWPLAKNCLSISALASATVTGASLTPRTVNYLVRIRHSHQILVGRLMFARLALACAP